ncbi:sialidase family protein, partial [Sulfitobacter sp. G21635-S1]|uniref:sialidase family protein n=1 Tax=Sulfitobacter sp. G21635-S1 TaxID=3014043 RepID=UPI0022AF4D45
AGTHLQATATGYDGASVPNAGVYRWVAAWTRWLRVSDTGLSGKADAAATATALATKADDAATTAALAAKADDAATTAALATKAPQSEVDELTSKVNALDAAIVLQDVWDATVGSFPGAGSAQRGNLWIVSVAGTVDGVEFGIGDRIVAIADDASTTTFAGNWFKEDYTPQVLRVNEKTGDVVLTKDDVELGLADNTPDDLKPVSGPQQTALDAVKDGAVAVPRQALYFGDEADVEDGEEVEVTEDGQLIRLGPTSQVARVGADLEDAKGGTGRWTLTFDPSVAVYDEVRTDAHGNILSGSAPLFDPATRWTLTFDAALIDKDVVEVDPTGKVLSATAALGLDAQPQDEAVPALSDTMQAYGAIGLADEATAWRADLDTNGAPLEDPANSPELTVITDAATMATYLPMVNRMVPVITQCHRSGRVWRAYYGNNGPLGTDPEEAGHDMFMLLEYTEDFADGGVAPPATDGETDDVTWLPAAIIHYATNDDALVQDGQFFYTHQGYLVFAMAIKTTGDLQVNRAWVIQNPDTGEAADLDLVVDSTFVFGTQTFFGYGFAFQPHQYGTEHRFFMSGFPEDSLPRDVDKIPRYCRLRIHETRVQGVVTDVRAYSQVISEVQAMIDSEEEDFPEPTAVPVGGDELMMVFRTDTGAMERRSYDGGLSWTDEVDAYIERVLESTRSKTVLCRSPSGRLVWAFNNNGARLRMSVMVSYKGSAGQDSHWLPPVLLEERDRPLSSYPSLVFLRDRLGRYTGKFLVAYDRGRSRTYIGMSGDEVPVGTPGSTTWNELITCLVDEEVAAAAVTDTVLRYTTNPGVAVPA